MKLQRELVDYKQFCNRNLLAPVVRGPWSLWSAERASPLSSTIGSKDASAKKSHCTQEGFNDSDGILAVG